MVDSIHHLSGGSDLRRLAWERQESDRQEVDTDIELENETKCSGFPAYQGTTAEVGFAQAIGLLLELEAKSSIHNFDVASRVNAQSENTRVVPRAPVVMSSFTFLTAGK